MCNQTSKNFFPDIKKGDTFEGCKMSFFNGKGVDKTPMNLTGAQVLISFKITKGRKEIFAFSTENNTIIIPTPTNGEIFLQSRDMNYDALTYVFDVQVTFANGVKKTFFTNYWKICQDV